MSDYDRVMSSEISGLISPIRELGSAGSPGVSVVATRDDRWDARSYLVSSGSDAVLIDGNGNLEPLVALAREQGLDLHAALLTHTHEDHVAGIAELRAGVWSSWPMRPRREAFTIAICMRATSCGSANSRSSRSLCPAMTRRSSPTGRAAW